jgi:uncharacterized protein (AIM24 family)
MSVLDVHLDANESVFSESGELPGMTGSIQTTHKMGVCGGIFGALKRSIWADDEVIKHCQRRAHWESVGNKFIWNQ